MPGTGIFLHFILWHSTLLCVAGLHTYFIHFVLFYFILCIYLLINSIHLSFFDLFSFNMPGEWMGCCKRSLPWQYHGSDSSPHIVTNPSEIIHLVYCLHLFPIFIVFPLISSQLFLAMLAPSPTFFPLFHWNFSLCRLPSILSCLLPSFFPTLLPSFLPSFLSSFIAALLPCFLPSFLPSFSVSFP